MSSSDFSPVDVAADASGSGPVKPLWSGRFASAPDAAMLEFSTSLPVDARLWRHDLRGSRAHARMLGARGIIEESDARLLVEGLERLEARIEAGEIGFEGAPDEDIHSFVERHLSLDLGPVAGKLHTARSRNDQIALDVRLYLREALDQTLAELGSLRAALLERAEEHVETVLPGYTHLQRAQPVSLGHHFLAYGEMFERDFARLGQARERADELPLGAAALAGTGFPIDRDMVARELGFARVSRNSLDTVADRDHLLESTAALGLIALHLSRLAEELVLWSTPEWGFCRLDDRFSTGSSIMPQKRNPDSMELVRGKAARVLGDYTTLWTLVKALPLTYNRDLQEDKEPLFDAFDTVLSSLRITRGVIETTTFQVQRMREVAGGGFATATDVADFLVRRGAPFREAHEITGAVVRFCEERELDLFDLNLERWQSFDARFDEAILEAVRVDGSLAARDSYGGTAPSQVRAQLETARQRLEADQHLTQG